MLNENLRQKNLQTCDLKAEVILGELPRSLKRISTVIKKFDLIFLDPPYGNSTMIEETLCGLVLNKLIEKDGLILIESEEKSQFVIPEELKLYKEKKFGNTKITMLSY